MTTGASSNPCSDTFAGPRAWSEPETEQLADYLRNLTSTVNIYISFHSYGQYMLFPYGHTGEHVEHYEELVSLNIDIHWRHIFLKLFLHLKYAIANKVSTEN